MVARHYLIEGQVQGVGFRRFILKRVGPLNLSGWIRNLEDGRVEALLQGPEERLQEGERFLRRGPDSGRVDRVTARSVRAQETEGAFRIEGNGEKPWEN